MKRKPIDVSLGAKPVRVVRCKVRTCGGLHPEGEPCPRTSPPLLGSSAATALGGAG